MFVYDHCMQISKLRSLVAGAATLIAILFIVAANIFQSYAVILLSVEVVLLPTVYIIGNFFIEQHIEESYKSKLAEIRKQIETLNSERYRLLARIEQYEVRYGT